MKSRNGLRINETPIFQRPNIISLVIHNSTNVLVLDATEGTKQWYTQATQYKTGRSLLRLHEDYGTTRSINWAQTDEEDLY